MPQYTYVRYSFAIISPMYYTSYTENSPQKYSKFYTKKTLDRHPGFLYILKYVISKLR